MVSLLLVVFCHCHQVKSSESQAAPGSPLTKTGEEIPFPTKSVLGLYVNTSPAFSVSYPSQWLEKAPASQLGYVFRAETSEGFPSFNILLIKDIPMPLEDSTKLYISRISMIGKDVKLISDKETKLEDGNTAKEAEIEWINETGKKLNTLSLTVKKEDNWITIILTNDKGRIDEDLRKIAYSLRIKSEERALATENNIPDSLQQYGNSQVTPGNDIPDHLLQYSNLAVRWMQDYLRIDTTNPPGNEMQAAAFFKGILDQEGIENQVFEYAPGRANLWARIPHTSTEPQRPIVLLNHMDVVSSDASHWKYPPFSGAIIKGYMYGRGAQDMKSMGLAQLVVMVMLKREKVPLNRDVIFLAVSDEEVGGSGTGWMIANKRDLLGNAEFLINEGGYNDLLMNGRTGYINVDVGEKTIFWLRVVAHGEPGHGSKPIMNSAPNRLVRALDKIINYQPPIKVLPMVEELLHDRASYEPPERAKRLLNIEQGLLDKTVQQRIEADEGLNSMLRATISLTMLGGSKQTNVIPSEAWANLDVRLLPGDDPQQFLQSIQRIVDDPNVTVEPLSKNIRPANASATNTALFQAIREVSKKYFPGTPVVPVLSGGTNENLRYRPLGIICYGFTPFMETMEEHSTVHGNDERIRVEEVRRGPIVLYDVVRAVAGRR